MVDTRPVMDDGNFEEAIDYCHDGWWLTGEDSFVHVNAVMSVDGWNSYGSAGNLSLTDAQRTLMLWSDIVGQTSNGGITQLCDNYPDNLIQFIECVRALSWPLLEQRFNLAIVEQAGSLAEPRPLRPVPLTDDPEKWGASKARFAKEIARAEKPWWKPVTKKDVRDTIASMERLGEWQFEVLYIQAVNEGRIESGGERYFDFVWPPTEAAENFDSWFYSDECKEQSRTHVREFMVRNRNQLCRPA